MDNAFLNCVGRRQGEAAYLVLQLPILGMSREALFVPTAHPDEKPFPLKDNETLQKMDPASHDIQSHKIGTEYQRKTKAPGKLLSCRLCITTYNSVF